VCAAARLLGVRLVHYAAGPGWLAAPYPSLTHSLAAGGTFNISTLEVFKALYPSSHTSWVVSRHLDIVPKVDH
jgi:hypothetical protein